ncbi:MAG TPA: SLC13 family permease, partial [Candidatus Hodarchaeales archaeon]|nr:SLC13 family permease [Candidatus Hodarchaeales archaeon]
MGSYDVVFGGILVTTLLLLITDKVEKTKVSMTGAGVALFFAILPGSSEDSKSELIPNINALLELIHPDLMFIIIGMTLMIGVCAKTGMFEFLALKILKRSKGRPYVLLQYLSLLTLLSSALLDAYMAIILIGSITLISLEGMSHEGGQPVNAKPYLISEAIFANIGGMLTRVASPPNLI